MTEAINEEFNEHQVFKDIMSNSYQAEEDRQTPN